MELGLGGVGVFSAEMAGILGPGQTQMGREACGAVEEFRAGPGGA